MDMDSFFHPTVLAAFVLSLGALCIYGCHANHEETIECMKRGVNYSYINERCIEFEGKLKP